MSKASSCISWCDGSAECRNDASLMSAHVQRVKLPSKTTVTLKPPHLLVHNKDEIEVNTRRAAESSA